MDEMVVRAMLKWPNVPSVYGWLRLDRRGRWLIRHPDKTPEAARAGGGPVRFERITNAAMNEFISRNYAHDPEGRYYFQNGPQRVYVALDYTPWIYRFDASYRRFTAHTGAAAGAPRQAFLDDEGGLIVVCEPGPGAVLDRDLAALADAFRDGDGRALDFEALIDAVAAGDRVRARFDGGELAIGAIRAADVAARLGFVADPRPPDGQPEC